MAQRQPPGRAQVGFVVGAVRPRRAGINLAIINRAPPLVVPAPAPGAPRRRRDPDPGMPDMVVAMGNDYGRGRGDGNGDGNDDPDDPDDNDDGPDPPMAEPFRRHRRGVRDDAFDREAEGAVPTDGKPWAQGPHSLYTPRLLTVDDPRAPNPPGFKGDLYAPQATLLHAMLELERRPVLEVEGCPPDWGSTIQGRCARISERFSFGKTVMSLALICAQRVPRRLPEGAPVITYPLLGKHVLSANRACIVSTPHGGGNYDPASTSFLPEIDVRYSRFLPLTVVVAAANVISQWEENTRRFTDLRYFIVENVRSLREFEEMYRRGQVADYDLLFVKAGRVTTSFVVAGEPKPREAAKNRSLFEAIARVLEGVPVARLLVDDFDTLKLGSDDCFFPALFTWLISATRRQTTAKSVQHGGDTLEDFLRANMVTAFPVLGAALDDILNKVFSLHCAPEYVDAHINSTAIGFRRIFVAGGRAAEILRQLDVAEEVVEMVNADAVDTAARALNIEAHSIGEVIHRVVGGHLEKLRHAVRALARVARAREALAARRGPPETDRELIKELRAALKDGTDAEAAKALAAVSGGGKDVLASLASLEEWAQEQKAKNGTTLGRMRDNIRQGDCQVCQVPFSEDADPAVGAGEPPERTAAYVLAGCCQIIVCEHCITKKGPNGRGIIIPRCPNCARPLNVKKGLVRVGAELDLDAALNDESLLQEEGDIPPNPAADPGEKALLQPPAPVPAAGPAPAAEPAPAAPVDPIAALDNTKLRALLQLVTGRPVDCLRDVATGPYVAGLLAGRRNSAWPPGKPKKFLVFTVHAESTRLLHDTLTRFAVPHCVLSGTRAQKDEAVRCIREDVGIMLVTAPKDCGGLNLPFLSHIVFYHRILDRNVEAQVAARGQRLGREHNLEVLTIVNEAEADGLP